MTSSRPSSEELAIVSASRKGGCRSGAWCVLQFGLLVFAIASGLSVLALPWLDLSWWQVFRRCVSIASAASLWIMIRRVQKRSFSSYGLSRLREGKRDLLFGVVLGIGTLLSFLALGLLTGACRIAVTSDDLRLWRTLLPFIPAALLIGILEELVFRGLILQQLLTCSKPLAVLVSSACYSAVHLKTTTSGPSIWMELGGLFLLGAVLAFSYLRTGRLYLAIGLHGTLAYGARVNKLLVAFQNPSLSWLVGTSRLVNGLLSWVVLLGIGSVIWMWTGKQGGARHASSI